MEIARQLATELNQPLKYIENVILLIDEGNTIPFIARYRKEQHGSMGDTVLRELDERLAYLRNLEKRRKEVQSSIASQDKLTREIEKAIASAETIAELDDIYRPYRPKRRTRATEAKKKGLEPLADTIFEQSAAGQDLYEEAAKYISEELGVLSADDALRGASDIIAERISDSADIRKGIKEEMRRSGALVSQKTSDADSVYRDYYGFSQPISQVSGHRILAVNRGEKEGFLKVSVEIERERVLEIIYGEVLKEKSPYISFITSACEDAWDRLIYPSVERELRGELTDTANEGAIRNFSVNLKNLLMQPPVKGHVTMGLDPGYRNGCKVAVVDKNGKVLDTGVIYPTFGERQKEEGISRLIGMIRHHHVEHIAIGNGTASRETEQMTAEMLQRIKDNVSYTIVSEAGASVYSASKLASEEMPQLDVNLRSAVSIARRLQDPLAELVKIDPKAIGVGQYQHDMPQKRLDEALATVVEDCVNAVGVDVNTASPALLQRVSGLNAATASNIVAYREENGSFTGREQLLKVPKLGPKAYEQCAGFLRVPESGRVLDNTGVHPESYNAAENLLELCSYTLEDVKNGSISELKSRVEKLGAENVAELLEIGVPTLNDIVQELMKPGRDPRDELPQPVFRTDVMDISDIKPGMTLKGTVRNVVDFGAFVDIGVHQDGLVHISEIADRFIRHPSEVLKVGDIVSVEVLSVDELKGRISLSIARAKNKGGN